MINKKNIIAGISTVAMLMSMGSTAFATTTNSYETLDNLSKEVITGGFEEFDNPSVKAVTEGEIGGGYWIRGIGLLNVESKFKHYSKLGRGKSLNRSGNEKKGEWKDPGNFSNGTQLLGFGTQTARAYYESK